MPVLTGLDRPDAIFTACVMMVPRFARVVGGVAGDVCSLLPPRVRPDMHARAKAVLHGCDVRTSMVNSATTGGIYSLAICFRRRFLCFFFLLAHAPLFCLTPAPELFARHGQGRQAQDCSGRRDCERCGSSEQEDRRLVAVGDHGVQSQWIPPRRPAAVRGCAADAHPQRRGNPKAQGARARLLPRLRGQGPLLPCPRFSACTDVCIQGAAA